MCTEAFIREKREFSGSSKYQLKSIPLGKNTAFGFLHYHNPINCYHIFDLFLLEKVNIVQSELIKYLLLPWPRDRKICLECLLSFESYIAVLCLVILVGLLIEIQHLVVSYG